jgi:hypothetical protein
VKESPEPPGEGNTGSRPAWGKPRPVGTEESLSHPARGRPEPLVIRATGTPVRLPVLVRRAAQRTLRNQRDGAARQGEAPPSHTWRGLVPFCPTRQNSARTDTPPPLPAAFGTAPIPTRHPLSAIGSVTPQPPGRTPHKAPQAPLQCPGGEDPPPAPPDCAPPARPSEALAREAMKSVQFEGADIAGRSPRA